MGVFRAMAAIAVMVGLGGCASVISGTSQTLTLDTVPSGADCSLSKKGLVIGRVNPTPGAVYVQRTRDDITVECKKDGYQTGTFINRSGLEAATLGNVILGGLVGVVVDAASGANNKYDERMLITLAALEPGQDQPAQTQASATSMSDPAKPARPPGPPLHAIAPVEFHCPSAGTVFRTSTGQQFKFNETNGMRCGYTDESGNARERYAVFVDGFGRYARKEMDSLWPLKVGSRAEFEIIDTSPVQQSEKYLQRNFRESFSVVRQESISVPAGTFDTLVVEWREQSMGIHTATEVLITLWYAPQPGYIVKSSVRLMNESATDQFNATPYDRMNYEAAAITLANGEPFPVASGGLETRGKPGVPQPPAASRTPQNPNSVPAATPASASPADRMRALNDLRDQKLITPEEYETRRKAILDEL